MSRPSDPLPIRPGPRVERVSPLSPAERADKVREALGWRPGMGEDLLPAGSVILTPDEQETIRAFIEFVLSSGMPDWDDVEAGEEKVLALLGKPSSES